MAMSIVHFGFGFAGALFVGALLGYEEEYGIAAVSGFWALIPQLHLLIPDGSPLRESVYGLLYESAIGNVFWFNQFITQYAPGGVHPADGSHVVGAVAFATLLAVTAYVDVKRADLHSVTDGFDYLRTQWRIRRSVRTHARYLVRRRRPTISAVFHRVTDWQISFGKRY